MDACTVVARRDLPAARVLARSFLDHHRGATFTVLVIDDLAEECTGDEECFDVVRASAIGLAPGDLAHLALVHDQAGLVAALTPALVRMILARGAPNALFLAPDVCIYAPLDDLAPLAEEHGLVVVPRLVQPPSPHDADTDAALRAGSALDDGLVAVGRGHDDILNWWQQRLARPGETVAWLDLTPGMFGAHVMRDPGYQVAAWNLSGRAVRRTDDGFEIDGRPLRSFRFQGYDPDWAQLRQAGAPLVLGERPELDALAGEYGQALRAAGWDQKETSYGYGVLPDDGGVVDDLMRGLYRAAVTEAGDHGGPLPPNPFTAEGEDAFVRWLNEPAFPPIEPTISRYLARLWIDSDDLRQRFPSLAGRTVAVYLEWVLAIGAAERHLPRCVHPSPELVQQEVALRRAARPRFAPQPGVNLVGYLDAVSGIGEVGRVLVDAVRHAGAPVAPVSHGETMSPREVGTVEAGPPSGAGYDINILCVNAAQTPDVASQLGPEFFAGRRTIGVWFWEVEDFELPIHGALDLVDEIWVASDFTRNAIASVSPKPVRTVPVPIRVPDVPATIPRRDLGLPEDRFVFYFSFDFLSVPGRKNPVGAVEAFTRAFGPDEGPVLVLKSINGQHRPAARQAVRDAACGRRDVIVIDGQVPPEKRVALLASCDGYVSLHRSEGFGLTIAEAMLLGKPVITTGYSGNLEFMDEDDSYLVEYEMRPIGPGSEPYPATSRWAEPDLDHAAVLMRGVVANPIDARERGVRAAQRIRSERSVEACAPVLLREIESLRHAPAPPATWRSFFMRGWRVEPREEGIRRYQYDWLPDGTPVDAVIGRLLGEHGPQAPGAPFPEDVERFLAWLNEPVVPEPWPAVSRYLYEFWKARPDMQEHFPDVERDAAAYLSWLGNRAYEETDIPYVLIPTPPVVAGETVAAVARRLLGDPGARPSGAPDPDDADALMTWLNDPLVPERLPVISRYLYELWKGRPDLQEHFPDVVCDPSPYLSWLHQHARDETHIPHSLIPTSEIVERARHARPTPRAVPPGLRGVGYRVIRATSGALRRSRSALRRQRGTH
ncbi:MAG: glycosyltransferase [Acidimicrobiia bacterium]